MLWEEKPRSQEQSGPEVEKTTKPLSARSTYIPPSDADSMCLLGKRPTISEAGDTRRVDAERTGR